MNTNPNPGIKSTHAGLLTGIGVVVMLGLLLFVLRVLGIITPTAGTPSIAILIVIMAAGLAPLMTAVFKVDSDPRKEHKPMMDRRRLALKIGTVLFLLLGMAVFLLQYFTERSAIGANDAGAVRLTVAVAVMNFIVIVGIAVVMILVRRSGSPRKRKNESLDDVYAVNDLGEVVLGDDGELVYFDEKPKRDDASVGEDDLL